MNSRLFEKMKRTCFEKLELVNGKTKHFTFLVDKNKIIHYGWNDYFASHPIILKWNYGHKRLHSEVAAILPFRNNLQVLKGLDLVNLRVNTFGEVGMSKPCDVCSQWVAVMGFKNIYYTDPNGILIKA